MEWYGPWRAAADLGALWALAFAAPMFDLLAGSPEFFVARGNTGSDVIVFALVYGLAPPLAAAAVLAVLGRAHRAGAAALHHLLLALLAAALVLPPLAGALGGSAAAIGLALALGAGGALLYARRKEARSFLALLAPAPLLFVLLFLVFSPVAELVWPGDAEGAGGAGARSATPVVFVVLDELPATTLADEHGHIDGHLFPHIAAFARTSTWYRNATTVADKTMDAVPALLTGERPRLEDLPTAQDHPRSLFTLFGESHAPIVAEPLTDVCPRRLCPETLPPAGTRLRALADDLSLVAEHLLLPDDLRDDLPPIDQSWEGFDPRAARPKVQSELVSTLRSDDARVAFRQAIAALRRPRTKPPLVFLHSTLPHAPWRYLPDGTSYEIRGKSNPGLRDAWTRRRWLIEHNFKRHLLQVQYTDRLLGELLAAVRDAGLFDEAVIVVASDHGTSFRPGEPRRELTQGNLADLASSVLLVKEPGQRTARVDDAAVQTVDVLPTIARAAGVEIPWRTDGRPASERTVDPFATVEMTRNGEGRLRTSLRAAMGVWRERDQQEARLLRHGIFGIGTRPDLHGRAVPAVDPSGQASIDGASDYATVDPAARVRPLLVSGELDGVPTGTVLAIAVNGRIAATTRSYSSRYVALIPPTSLAGGANRVEILEVTRGDRLRALGSTSTRRPAAPRS